MNARERQVAACLTLIMMLSVGACAPDQDRKTIITETAASAPATSNTAANSTASNTPATNAAPAPLPAPPAPALPPQGAWYRGDLHSHTNHSDDARRQGGDNTATTLRLAEYIGLDYLAVTDHRTDAVLRDPQFTSNSLVLLAGDEWGGPCHAGAIGITAAVPEIDSAQSPATYNAQVQAAIDEVHRQGGVFVLNHPVHTDKVWVWDVKGYDAIEVWNQPWSFRRWEDSSTQHLDGKRASVGQTALNIPPHRHIEKAIAYKGGGENYQGLRFWEQHLHAREKVAIVGGGDRHMLFPQGFPCTWVFATTRDRQGVLDGIRRGRTFVTRTPAGPRVHLTADGDGDGIFEALSGDTLTMGGTKTFRVEILGGGGGRMEIVQDGNTILRIPIVGPRFQYRFTLAPTKYTWVRADVYEPANNFLPAFALLGPKRASQASLLSVFTAIPGSLATNLGTTLPTIMVQDEENKLLNLWLQDLNYCMGAISGAIFVE